MASIRNFAVLANATFTNQSEWFQAVEHGRGASDDAAQIMENFRADTEYGFSFLPVVEGDSRKKAKRVTRHLARARDQFLAARDSMKAAVAEFNKVYGPEMAASRNKGRKRFEIV